MNIPPTLVNQVREGRAVLFLGAGATVGARGHAGSPPPDANRLRDLIAKRFLSGDASENPLPWVAELAASSSSLYEMQDYVAEQFANLIPAPFHSLIPTFVWRGIATTNYDRLIETVYDRSADRTQNLAAFLSDQDRVDHKLRDRSTVALLKLHGCITRTHDERLPLILGLDQYATVRENRHRLFRMFEEWAIENTVIFVGHRLQDPNLRGLLINIIRTFSSRPRYYLIRPGVDPVEASFWESKEVTVWDGTFEMFLKTLDSRLDRRTRGLMVAASADHPIQQRFVVRAEPSESLVGLLHSEFEYIHPGLSIETINPKHFYRGAGLGWAPIAQGLDVQRGLTSKILEDVVLRPEGDRTSRVELYAIRAEAGAGKSVLLRRLAWDASARAGALCLFFKGTAPASFESIRELADAINERIFLFVDNAAQRLQVISELMSFGRRRELRVTIITAERLNEWNVSCEALDNYLTDSFQLRYLSHLEIGDLVDLLAKHESLGPHLERRTREEQIEEFEKRAGRQLLVALHEATLGKPFEEILLNEYDNLVPPEAKSLYLTVCALNRLKVPVRAGLISRVHGIPFEDFQTRLFKPLEHVVFVSELPWGDFGYRARHSEIAQIVFDRALADASDRYNEYSRILKALNTMYSIDLSAARDMIRAKWVHRLFPSYADAKAIFDIAFQALPHDSYLLQQRANYERIRPGGNLRLAEKLLAEARSLDPRNATINHTLAEVLRAKAKDASDPLERAKHRAEARSVLGSARATYETDQYAQVTRIKLAVDEVRDLLSDPNSTDRELDEVIRNAERVVEDARQRFPGDQYVLAAEAEFAELLSDHERSVKALEAARRANPRDPFIASRLSNVLVSRGEIEKARDYLEEALESNSGDKRLNFQYAEVLRSLGDSQKTLAYYYRKAFTKWDENYESQFWFARFAYEFGTAAEIEEAREVFRRLQDVPMSHAERIKVRDLVGGLGSPRSFNGSISRVESSHGFIVADGRGDWLFFHQTDVAEDAWEQLRGGVRVAFHLAFSLKGPKAVRLKLESAIESIAKLD